MEIEDLRDVVRKIVHAIVSRKAELGRTFVFEEDDTRSQGGVRSTSTRQGDVDDRPRKRPRGLVIKGARH